MFVTQHHNPQTGGSHVPHPRMVWRRISFTCANSYKSPSNDFVWVKWQRSAQRDNNTGVLSVNNFLKCFHAQQRRWKAQTETGRRTSGVKVFTESPWWYTGPLHRSSHFVAWSACPIYTVQGKGRWGKLQNHSSLIDDGHYHGNEGVTSFLMGVGTGRLYRMWRGRCQTVKGTQPEWQKRKNRLAARCCRSKVVHESMRRKNQQMTQV